MAWRTANTTTSRPLTTVASGGQTWDQSLLPVSMTYLLASDGLNVRPFDKLAEFLAYVATNPVAVVVTDIWMDEVTGLEILARMCALSPL
jgi:FixJ family two-component response regulator